MSKRFEARDKTIKTFTITFTEEEMDGLYSWYLNYPTTTPISLSAIVHELYEWKRSTLREEERESQ